MGGVLSLGIFTMASSSYPHLGDGTAEAWRVWMTFLGQQDKSKKRAPEIKPRQLDSRTQVLNDLADTCSLSFLPPDFFSLVFGLKLPFPARDPWTVHPQGVRNLTLRARPSLHLSPFLQGNARLLEVLDPGVHGRERERSFSRNQGPVFPTLPWERQLLEMCLFLECFHQEQGSLVLPDTLQDIAGICPEACVWAASRWHGDERRGFGTITCLLSNSREPASAWTV